MSYPIIDYKPRPAIIASKPAAIIAYECASGTMYWVLNDCLSSSDILLPDEADGITIDSQSLRKLGISPPPGTDYYLVRKTAWLTQRYENPPEPGYDFAIIPSTEFELIDYNLVITFWETYLDTVLNPPDATSLIDYLRQIREGVSQDLQDPEKVADALAETIVQYPCERILVLTLAARRLLERLAKKRDPGKGKDIVQDTADKISRIAECLRAESMQLGRLSGRTQIPKEQLKHLLAHLRASGFVSLTNDRRYMLVEVSGEA